LEITLLLSLGTNKKSLFIKPTTLLQAYHHKLVLNTSTPGSGQWFHEDFFLTNKVPFGGSCGIEPLTGKHFKSYLMYRWLSILNFLIMHAGTAAYTNFSVVCNEWQEFEGAGQLKYEYRVRQKGNKRSLLFYFGDQPGSTPTMLPVGNYEESFLDECVLLIYDSIGDFWLLTQPVTVESRACSYCTSFFIVNLYCRFIQPREIKMKSYRTFLTSQMELMLQSPSG
jgi:hypothetical protein